MADAVSVTLGGMGEQARAYIADGRYASMSEVVRAGLRALKREEDMLHAYYKAKIAASIADQRPRVPLDVAIARVLAASLDEDDV